MKPEFSFANHPFLSLLLAIVVLALVQAALELLKGWIARRRRDV